MVSSFGCPDKPFQLPLNGVNTARQLILWFLEFLRGYNLKKKKRQGYRDLSGLPIFRI
jgi:hypothetical protein